MLTVGSLFAGIGGLELGLERTGYFKTVWQVEIDDYANQVLAKHWPDARRWRDVTTFPPDALRPECESGSGRRGVREGDTQPSAWACDLICGGFPCQDISYAGAGAGLAGERSGLFYEAARIIRTLGPRYVLLENVAALLTRGIGEVLGTLASLGYDAEWHCIPAASVGAPHIRDRVFILAYAEGERCGQGRPRGTAAQGEVREAKREDVPNARCEPAQVAEKRKLTAEQITKRESWWATEPDVCGSSDGFPDFLDRHIGRGLSYEESQRAVKGLRSVWDEHVSQEIQWAIGGLSRIQAAEILFALMREYARGGGLPRAFVAGTEALGEQLRDLRGIALARCAPSGRGQGEQQPIEYQHAVCDMPREIASWNTWEGGIDRVASGVTSRMDRLRCLGNAVVPQVAEWIGHRIMEMDRVRQRI